MGADEVAAQGKASVSVLSRFLLQPRFLFVKPNTKRGFTYVGSFYFSSSGFKRSSAVSACSF